MVLEYFDVTYKSSKTNNLIDMHKYCKNKNKLKHIGCPYKKKYLNLEH